MSMTKETGSKEAGKKTKAPAKAKRAGQMPEGEGSAVKAAPKAAAKTKAKAAGTTVVEVAVVLTPSYEEIARLAQRYWAERGWQDGYAEQDWLRAERELLGMAS
jgi:hypothetical protein